MLVSRSRFDRSLKDTDAEIKALREKYWALSLRYSNLLSHLGLTEVDVPAKTEIKTKRRAGECLTFADRKVTT